MRCHYHARLSSGELDDDDEGVSISEVVGPYAWGVIHHAVESFPCEECALEGGRLMHFAHDLVNSRLGKDVVHPEDFAQVFDWTMAAAEREGLVHTHPAGELAELPVALQAALVEAGLHQDESDVRISGKCTGERECSIKVTASDRVSEQVSSPTAIGDAVARARRRLDDTRAVGRTTQTTAIGPEGLTRYELRYRVVEASDLVVSTDAFTFEDNPDFPVELQPRQRARAANRLQVERIAANLDPDILLGEFQSLDRGAPIINAAGVVLSGNGRAMAIQRAAELHPARYNEYVDQLINRAGSFGLDAQDVTGFTAPVLVRELLGDVDEQAFVQEANASTTIEPSAIEQARADAARISTAALQELQVRDDQSIDEALRAQANNAFVSGFLQELPSNEQARLVDGEGRLNQDGLRRLGMAIFVRTFQGDAGLRLAELWFESLDPNLRNIFHGIAGALGPLARAESLTAAGDREPELAIGEDLAAAVNVLSSIKRTPGLTVDKYLAQSQLFERELTPFQELVLVDLDVRSRASRRIGVLLRRYADAVVATAPPAQGSLIPESVKSTKQDLWIAAAAEAETAPDDARLFLPDCTGEETDRLERCVMELKDDPNVESAFAVCSASIGCTTARS